MPKSLISTIPGLLFLGLFAGCGGGAINSTKDGPPPPHSGVFVPLPDGAGAVEVVKKTIAPGASGEEEASFYFFKSGTTPYSPSPTAGSLTIDEGKKIDLVVKGDALVTPPGPSLFGADDVNGLLSVTLGGSPVSVRLGGR